jgi:hypothetical protein
MQQSSRGYVRPMMPEIAEPTATRTATKKKQAENAGSECPRNLKKVNATPDTFRPPA